MLLWLFYFFIHPGQFLEGVWWYCFSQLRAHHYKLHIHNATFLQCKIFLNAEYGNGFPLQFQPQKGYRILFFG